MHNFYYVFPSEHVARARERKIITHLGSQKPPKSRLGGVNKHFQPKQMQY